MGNVCASSRNKECFYIAKNPSEIKNAFNECVTYRKCNDKKTLKKKKRKLLRKIENIENLLSQSQQRDLNS